jgi:glutamate synthase domain-containing protein 3
MGMVGLETLFHDAEIEEVANIIKEHVAITKSPLGEEILADFSKSARHFVKVSLVSHLL